MVITENVLGDLIKVREIIDSLIETLDVMSDEELMESIRKAEEDIKSGRVRLFEEFLKELEESGL